MFNSSGSRLLIDAHIRECRDNRERTTSQFNAMDKRIDQLDKKVDLLDDKSDRRHEENTEKLNRIMRYIWIAMGALAVISFATSHDGMAKLLELIGGGK